MTTTTQAHRGGRDALPAVSVAQTKAIATAVRAAMAPHYRPNSCIETTSILAAVLARLGVPATPTPVTVMALNQAAQDAMAAGLPFERWPADAWSVGVAPGQAPRPGGWPGHLVCVVHTAQVDRLVDGSADQMSRPAKGLAIPGPVVGRVPDGWGGDRAAVAHLHATNVVLRWEPLDDDSWRVTNGWAGEVRHRRTRFGCAETALAALARAGITPGTFTREES